MFLSYLNLNLANPPTGKDGHRGIVKYLIETNLFDEIWILPVYVHQFTIKRLIDFNERIEMCERNFLSLETNKTKVKVLPTERVVNELLNGKHGTIDTITFIQQQNPSYTLHLIIGEDAYRDICNNKWKEGERYLLSVHLFFPISFFPYLYISHTLIYSIRLFQVSFVHVIDRLGLPPLSALSSSSPSLTLSSEDIIKQSKYKPFQRHTIPFLQNVSSTLVKSLNPYPYWPLPIENSLLVSMLDPLVYQYIKEKKLYNFSAEYQWKQRFLRGTILGVIVYLCLYYKK